MTNFSKNPIVLHKHIPIALRTDPPESIVEPGRTDGLKLTVEVNSVHYKEVAGQEMQTERHVKVENKEAKQKEHD